MKNTDDLKATNVELVKALTGLLEIGRHLELRHCKYTTHNWLLWQTCNNSARAAIAKAKGD